MVASYTTLEKAGPARTTQGGYQSEFAAEGLRMQMPQRLRAKSISRSPATERPPRVLIIDDDEAVATHVRDIVRDANFGPMNEIPDVFYVTDVRQVDKYLSADDIDLYIVDLKLRYPDNPELVDRKLGMHLVRKIAATCTGGQIIYSSEDIDTNNTEALADDGADDYIQKETVYDKPNVIRSKIKKLWGSMQSKRALRTLPTLYTGRTFAIGEWQFVVGTRELSNASGATIKISPAEHAILRHIVLIEDHKIDRESFAAYILGRSLSPNDRRLDNIITRLRPKLGPTVEIIGQRGEGYKIPNIFEKVRVGEQTPTASLQQVAC